MKYKNVLNFFLALSVALSIYTMNTIIDNTTEVYAVNETYVV